MGVSDQENSIAYPEDSIGNAQQAYSRRSFLKRAVGVVGGTAVGLIAANTIIRGVGNFLDTGTPKTASAAENPANDNEYKPNQPLNGINVGKLTIKEGVNIRANPRTTYNLNGQDAEERIIDWGDIVTVNGQALNGSSVFDLENAVVFDGQNAHHPDSPQKASWAFVVIGRKDGSEEAGFIFLGKETNDYVTGDRHIEKVIPNIPFVARDLNGNVIPPSEYGKVTIPSQHTPTANTP